MPLRPNSELTPTTVLTTPALLTSSGHSGSLQKHNMLMWRFQLYQRSDHERSCTEVSLSPIAWGNALEKVREHGLPVED